MNDQTAGNLHNSLLVRNADGPGQRQLFTHAERRALAPSWPPTGGRIAFGLGGFFQAIRGATTADIATIAADGTDLRIVTDGSGNFGLPNWSPDGRKLVYRGAGGKAHGIFVLDVASGAVSQVTAGAWSDNFPVWSPTGDRILFTSNRDGDYHLYTMRPDGSDIVRVTSTPGNDGHAAWSPDGQWIVFATARGGFKDEAPLHPYNRQPTGDLYVMRADGSDVHALTDDQFEDGTPTWLPSPRRQRARHLSLLERDTNTSRAVRAEQGAWQRFHPSSREGPP